MSRKKRRQTSDADPTSSARDPNKRPRLYTEQDAELAKLFDELADDVRDVRIKAAAAIVRKLSPDSNPSNDLALKVVTRLIRGLCSGRKAARSGFSVALVEVLRMLLGSGQKPLPGLELGVGDLVSMIEKLTEPEGKVAGQERKDHLLGRVFGYQAVIQSSILFSSEADPLCWTSVLDSIYKLALDVPWLREECGLILCEAASLCVSGSTDHRNLDELVKRLCSSSIAKTPEGVAIWLTAKAVSPELKFPQKIWHKDDPLCVKERTTLAGIMREDYSKDATGTSKQDHKVKSGSSQRRLKHAWDVVLASIIQKYESKNDTKPESSKKDFGKFWKEVVDNSLFSAAASLERKAVGFQLFAKALRTCPVWALEELCSPNLMRCIVNQRNDSERYLHDAARTPLDEMRARAKKQPEAAAHLVAGICKRNHMINFDQLTKTKTLENIIASANSTAFCAILDHFRTLLFNMKTEDEREANTMRRLLADLLLSAVRNQYAERPIPSNIDGTESWLSQLIFFFVTVAYLAPQDSERDGTVIVPPISSSTVSVFQSRLASCLTHLLVSKMDPEHAFPYLVISTIRAKTEPSTSEIFAWTADEEIKRAVARGYEELDNIVGMEIAAEHNKKKPLRALKLLYCLTLLQVYNGNADAVSILGELGICFSSMTAGAARDPGASGVLIEILLSFVSKPSLLFRKLAEEVFTSMTPDVTSDGLQSMLDILQKKESLSGQQEVFDNASESEEIEDGASDVEALDDENLQEDEDQPDRTPSSRSDDESVDTEGSGEEEDEELANFNQLLGQALQTSKPKDNQGNSNDSSDEDMDDEQMMALEPALAKIFRDRKHKINKKQEQKDAKDAMVHFKTRVLNLFQIYVKQECSNPLALDLILPIIRMIRLTANKQIAEKGFHVLKIFFDTSKSKGLPVGAETDVLWAALTEVHEEVMKSPSKLFASACSRSSLFLAKVLVSMDKRNYDEVVDIYSGTQKQWYASVNSKLQPSFLTEWISWSIATNKTQK